jgi:GTP-binding protein HflX
MNRKISTCLDTFNEIGANGTHIIAALNKIDLMDEVSIAERRALLVETTTDVIPISARNKTNLDELLRAIDRTLPNLCRFAIALPYGNESMSLLSWLHESAIVESESHLEESIQVVALLDVEAEQIILRILPDASVRRLPYN